MFNLSPTPIQSLISNHHLSLDIKRLDLIHPYISGNKYYKLKYNLEYVQQLPFLGIVSFGGAYSNHILALALACYQLNLKSMAIIRGNELKNKALNPILKQAQIWGMDFHFVSREEYRQRHDPSYLSNLQHQYPDYYILPEGGHNHLAIKGCQEILSHDDLNSYDYICCAVGTGGTLTGLSCAAHQQQIIGFSALKNTAFNISSPYQNFQIIDQYCFGGYAKYTPTLIQFMQNFQNQFNIPLDPIYTAKMMYGVFDLIEKKFFPPHSRILCIHTGGIIAGKYRIGEQYAI